MNKLNFNRWIFIDAFQFSIWTLQISSSRKHFWFFAHQTFWYATELDIQPKMIHKTYKLLFGIILLLVVDIIWVSSSELTKVCVTKWMANFIGFFSLHSFYWFARDSFFAHWIRFSFHIVCSFSLFSIHSFSIKMKASINHFFAHILKRQCLRCTFWCSD